jgi:hypothetical protein
MAKIFHFQSITAALVLQDQSVFNFAFLNSQFGVKNISYFQPPKVFKRSASSNELHRILSFFPCALALNLAANITEFGKRVRKSSLVSKGICLVVVKIKNYLSI